MPGYSRLLARRRVSSTLPRATTRMILAAQSVYASGRTTIAASSTTEFARIRIAAATTASSCAGVHTVGFSGQRIAWPRRARVVSFCVVFDTEAANEVFRSGAASEALDRIQEALQPEALYGFVEDGQRAFFAVFDLADPSQIPVISEPLFQRANVKITLTPCMTLEDVKKGVEEAARRMAAMQS